MRMAHIKIGTEYLQGDDARLFLALGYCEGCLKPASIWASEDKYGNILVHAEYDENDNLIGFRCPECAREGAGE